MASSITPRKAERLIFVAYHEEPTGSPRPAQVQLAMEAGAKVRRYLEDLPEETARELEAALRIIFEHFEQVVANASQPWKKAGRILKVIAYGGPLRPPKGAKDECQTINLLVVVNDQRLTDRLDYWSAVEDRLFRERRIAQTLRCQFDLLVYSLGEVNRQLESGARFFTQIISRGIALYEREGSNFARPRHLPERQARAASIAYFDFWYPRSLNARKLARYSLDEGLPSDAAFLLHQAAERAYHCVLMVLTLHSPKTHRLELLRSNSESVAPILARAWPRDTKFARRCFGRLRRAYGAGRYDPDYRITPDELHWLDERVGELQSIVRIEKAIQILPPVTRQVFAVRRAEGLDYEEIAARLGLTLRQVETRMERALESIIRDLKSSPWRPAEPETLQ